MQNDTVQILELQAVTTFRPFFLTLSYTMTPLPTRGFGRVIAERWVIPRCAHFVWKNKVIFTRVVIDSSPPALKRHIFLDIKHLYTAWVADAAGFHVR